MSQADSFAEQQPYHLLRTALALFQKTPSELDAGQLAQTIKQAFQEYEIETRVLESAEAAAVIVTDQAINKAVTAIRERFADEQAYLEVLSHNGLDQQSLQRALLRQCKVENVLERIASRASTVSEVEIGIFYHMHPEKFQRPEQRSVKHILITINEEFADNSRSRALQRIREIVLKLQHKPHKFADLALRHSECPSALQGGELGIVSKGQLYPEIEAALFRLKEGQISDIIETEVGFHVVQCMRIHRAESIPFKKAQPKIRKLMLDRSRRNCQRAWLASLQSDSGRHTVTN